MIARIMERRKRLDLDFLTIPWLINDDPKA
jgi:hypothetical protein